MKYKTAESHPLSQRPRQKTLAALLAAGASAKEAAAAVGVSVSYVNVLLKGDLFQYEVDEQRRILVGERLAEYTKLVSEQLEPNLRALIAMRDDPDTPPAARIRAIELINESVVPKAKPKQAAETKISVHLTPEQKSAITTAKAENDGRTDPEK